MAPLSSVVAMMDDQEDMMMEMVLDLYTTFSLLLLQAHEFVECQAVDRALATQVVECKLAPSH